MPSSRLATIDDITALSDAQLGEFMEKHRRPDGEFELHVADDWSKLSKGDRHRLAERLRSISGGSRSLDLDKLDALLRDVSSKSTIVSPDRPRERERQTESPDETDEEIFQQREREAYTKLVHDGGRALYTIDLIDSVTKDPNAYRDMLRPFWRGARCNYLARMDIYSPKAVFQRQWHRWQNFRKWQLDNRNIEEDDGFLAYVEEAKLELQEVGDLEGLAEIEADPTILKKPGEPWCRLQRDRNWQRRYQREPGCKGISEYEEAIKTRLARHGFTQAFNLAEDPKQQDKLTTWIEYLGFEYWWLDRYTASTKRLKLKHDEAWEELKRKGMIKNDETPDFIRTKESSERCQREEDDALKALQDAESEAKTVYQKTQRDPNRLSIPKQRRVEMVVEARKRLLAAQEALAFAERRSDSLTDFVCGTLNYDDAREDVVSQANLLEWAIAEAHTIAAELTVATPERTSQKRRQASTEDVCLVQSNPKRQKSGAHEHAPHASHDTIGKGNGRALRRRNGPSTDTNPPVNRRMSHNMHDTHPSQNKRTACAAEQIQNTNSSSQSTTLNMSSRELTQGLRRSSRLAALRAGPGTSSPGCGSHSPNNLGSRWVPVDKLLGKRIRKRGRGRVTEYLVKFSGHGSSCNLWTVARDLPEGGHI